MELIVGVDGGALDPEPRVGGGPAPGLRAQPAGGGLRHVHRVEGVAEQIGGGVDRLVEARPLCMAAQSGIRRQIPSRQVVAHRLRPAPRQQQHHPASRRPGEAAQGRRGPQHHPVEPFLVAADAGAEIEGEAVLVGEALRPDVADRIFGARPGRRRSGDLAVLIAVVDHRAGGQAAGPPRLLLLDRPGQHVARSGPVGEHVEVAAVERDDRHAVFRAEFRQLVADLVEHQVAIGRPEGEVVVDEDEDVRPHRLTGLDPRRRRRRGRPGSVGPRRRLLDRAPLGDLGEELDRHLLAVHPQPEVAGSEPADPPVVLVDHHRLEVDHPHLDPLGEDLPGVVVAPARPWMAPAWNRRGGPERRGARRRAGRREGGGGGR